MAKLYVSEYAGMLPGGIPSGPPITDQTPVTIGSTANDSAAFGVSTRAVRLHTDVVCSYNVNGAAATSSSARMQGNTTEYVSVAPGGKVSVITNS